MNRISIASVLRILEFRLKLRMVKFFDLSPINKGHNHGLACY